jgi:hypothetical protein
MNALKLNSAEKGVKQVRIPLESIADYYSFDEKEDYRVLSEQEMVFVSWASHAFRVLKKSKMEDAKKLAEDFEEIFEGFMSEVKQNKNGDSYTVINTVTGSRFCIKESLEEIDDMIEGIIENDRLGI